MEDISVPVYDENDVKQRSIFTVNDIIQVVFITDLKTGKKLDDDYNVNEYLQAVVQAHLLKLHGISDPEQVTSIVRSEDLDHDKTTIVIALDIVTNVQEGVDELRCSVSEEGLYTEIEEASSSEELSLSWNQNVPDIPDPLNVITDLVTGPTFRWTPEMTTQLIRVRGDMDREFAKAKYKFRLWEKVASKLNESLMNGTTVTAKDCDDKWRNMVATYRKNIDKVKSFGDSSVRWEYFTAMDHILKGTRDLSDFTDNLSNDDPVSRHAGCFTPTEIEVKSQPIDVVDLSADQSSIEEIEIDESVEPIHDCVITRKLDGDKRKWTTDQCLMLIYLRHQMDRKFNELYKKAPHLWRNLACQMNANFLSDFSASELESVWNHCVMNYDINLENLKSKGVDSVKWKYFAVMDEIRGGTQEISDICVPKPGENLLKEFQKIHQRNSVLLPNVNSQCFNASVTCNLKDETDSEDTSIFSNPGITWTQEMVKMLISLKKLIEQDIIQHKIPKKKQWWIMVRKFRTLKNVKLSEEACEEKWRNLVRTYKKNLIRVKKRGAGVIRWSYFWKMHEIMNSTIVNNEARMAIPSVELMNKTRLTETAITEFLPNKNRPLPMNDQFIEYTEDILEETIKEQHENLSSMIRDLRDKQNKMLQEIIDIQNKKIEELHQEQLNIKALLTQLLQKFP